MGVGGGGGGGESLVIVDRYGNVMTGHQLTSRYPPYYLTASMDWILRCLPRLVAGDRRGSVFDLAQRLLRTDPCQSTMTKSEFCLQLPYVWLS